MNKREQKEAMKSMVVWSEESIESFYASFLAHYHVLDTLIEDALDCSEIEPPRLAYFTYTEFLSTIYTELCLVIECLLKSILDKSGYDRSKIKSLGHNLIKLYDIACNIEDEESQNICTSLGKYKSVLVNFSQDNVFVNARYMEFDHMQLHEWIDQTWDLLTDIDYIAQTYFAADNLIDILYPDSMVN